jgi:hypothetical protein
VSFPVLDGRDVPAGAATADTVVEPVLTAVLAVSCLAVVPTVDAALVVVAPLACTAPASTSAKDGAAVGWVADAPAAVVALVALVAGIAMDKLWPLVFLHVSFGAAWTIIDLFLGLVLGPIMGSMPPAARVAFTTRLMPKMLLIMPTVVTITLAAGWQLGSYLGTVTTDYPLHDWLVASYIVVGVMAIIALGLLEPANVAVLIELKKPQPDFAVIERLMKRFILSAGVIGIMQIATLVIMTKIASG